MEYKDLVQMWEDGRKKWEEYRWDVGKIAAFIAQDFATRLNITDKNILKLFPESESDDQKVNNSLFSPIACVEFKDNGWAL